MPAALVLTDESLDDIDEFAVALEAVGLKAWRSTLSAARTFAGRVERAGAWELVDLETQLAWMRRARPFVSWLLVTGRLQTTAEFLALVDLRLEGTARKHLPETGLPPDPWRVSDWGGSLASVGGLTPAGRGRCSGSLLSICGSFGEELFVGEGWEHSAGAVTPAGVVGVDGPGDGPAGQSLGYQTPAERRATYTINKTAA